MSKDCMNLCHNQARVGVELEAGVGPGPEAGAHCSRGGAFQQRDETLPCTREMTGITLRK